MQALEKGQKMKFQPSSVSNYRVPLDAVITKVHPEGAVDLRVFWPDGMRDENYVVALTAGEARIPGGHYCFPVDQYGQASRLMTR